MCRLTRACDWSSQLILRTRQKPLKAHFEILVELLRLAETGKHDVETVRDSRISVLRVSAVSILTDTP